jgi:hypothetical protein
MIMRPTGDGYELARVDLRSETVPRQGPRARAAPSDVLLRTYRRNRAFYDEITNGLPATVPEPQATVRLLSGCQDNQLSLDGTFNGLFTGTLLRVWNDGRFKGNYRDFHRAIVSRMPEHQSPNHFVIGPPSPSFDAERPFVIG